MKKLYYLGALTTFTGTVAFVAALVQHIQNAAASSQNLLVTAAIICLGSIIMSTNKSLKTQQ